MSLSSALFSGTSGLKNTSKGLQVTSNNISNTKTVGFKKGRTTFADTLYQTVGTQGGAAQVGLGTSVNSVSQNFSAGSIETTGNATDLAIGGDGFFVVSQPGSDKMLYTRAGNFSFNKSGALVTPGGCIVQGWNLDPKTGDQVGAITDLVLKQFTSPPDKTKEISVKTNLNADAKSKSSVLANAYKAGKTTAVASDTYEYQSVIKVYDSLGSARDVTVYYDKKSDTEWEYIIVSDAKEDKRNLVQGTSSQGLLARGTIDFSKSSGKITGMTMERFTGRIGNVSSVGINKVDDIHFEIKDSESMLLDGYGIEMKYDAGQWVLNKGALPDKYKNAKILSSDGQNISVVLDPASSGGDKVADLKIKLKKPAMAGDIVRFDINDVKDLHVQDLKGVTATGGAKNKTTSVINDPGVMVRDAEGCKIVWNPVTESWHWSNPEGAKDKGTLVSGMTTNNATAVNTTPGAKKVTNAADLPMKVDDVDLRYDNRTGKWDWNETFKKEDFVNRTYSPALQDKPELKIIDAGKEGAIATLTGAGAPAQISVAWNGTAWAVTGNGNTNVSIVPSESNNTKVQLKIHNADPTKAVTIEYDFGKPLAAGQTMSFEIDPSPPAEYGKAKIVTTGNKSVAIDFNGNNTTDLVVNVTSGATTTLAGGETFSFDVDPDVPPAEYSKATLTGDKNHAEIDLDGSGNKDVVFNFKDPLKNGKGTDPLADQSTISFDIEGSSVWQKVSTDEAKDTGHFKFTTDFLGGEFGSTETDISFDIGTKWDGNNWVNDSLSTTQYARASSTIYQGADGYPPGDLGRVEVSADGKVTGYYSNGQQIPLFMVGLADFKNPNGLENEGGNLYSATRKSGAAVTNRPGNNGLGELKSQSLEMSNVNVSDEFVNLIQLQNSYEANAKIISTVDEMMTTIIQMKR
ncbi:MAG: flagellar hook-basal body complex protein [Desulfobacterales bacterium]|nr:flagellar hook-basal body complex protein [Desulfobacterales bacterium]